MSFELIVFRFFFSFQFSQVNALRVKKKLLKNVIVFLSCIRGLYNSLCSISSFYLKWLRTCPWGESDFHYKNLEDEFILLVFKYDTRGGTSI